MNYTFCRLVPHKIDYFLVDAPDYLAGLSTTQAVGLPPFWVRSAHVLFFHHDILLSGGVAVDSDFRVLARPHVPLAIPELTRMVQTPIAKPSTLARRIHVSLPSNVASGKPSSP